MKRVSHLVSKMSLLSTCRNGNQNKLLTSSFHSFSTSTSLSALLKPFLEKGSATEEQMGILCFLSASSATTDNSSSACYSLSSIIKQNLHDFQVREIDLNDSIVEIPKPTIEDLQHLEEQKQERLKQKEEFRQERLKRKREKEKDDQQLLEVQEPQGRQQGNKEETGTENDIDKQNDSKRVRNANDSSISTSSSLSITPKPITDNDEYKKLTEVLQSYLTPQQISSLIQFHSHERERYFQWFYQHPQPVRPLSYSLYFHVDLTKDQRKELHQCIRDNLKDIITDMSVYIYDSNDPLSSSFLGQSSDSFSSIHIPSSATSSSTNQSNTPTLYFRCRFAPLTPIKAQDQRFSKLHSRVQSHAQLTKSSNSSSSSSSSSSPSSSSTSSSSLTDSVSSSNFLYFSLYKSGLSTEDAIHSLSNLFHSSIKVFGFAGTKDKRACTTQRISCYRGLKERFEAKSFQLPPFLKKKLFFNNFSYSSKGLRLGDLNGNQFEITLRNIKTVMKKPSLLFQDEKEAVEVAEKQIDQIESEQSLPSEIETNFDWVLPILDSLSTHGFINYYGLQRFGNTIIPTSLIGQAVMKQNFSLVISMLLMPKPNDYPDVRTIKESVLKTFDYKEGFEKLPKSLRIEKKICEVLMKQGPNSFQNAFDALPRTLRLMYVHAWQSYIWNHIVSIRLTQFDRKPMVGDLVILKNDKANNKKQQSNEADEVSVESSDSEEQEEGMEDAEELDMYLDSTEVYVLTEDDVVANRYKLSDIVLPLPGCNVTYPNNKLAAEYLKLLKDEGVSPDVFHTHPIKECRLQGGYRTIVAVPKDFQYHFFTYNNSNQAFVLTDLEKYQGKEREPIESGPFHALHLSFRLPSSTYATMLLREVTRESTSTHEHKVKNHYEKRKPRGFEEPTALNATEEMPVIDEAVCRVTS